MWIVIFLGGALLTGYALYRQAVRESGSRFQCRHCGHTFRTEWKNLFSSLRTYVSDRVEKSVSCHTQLGRI